MLTGGCSLMVSISIWWFCVNWKKKRARRCGSAFFKVISYK